MYPLQEHKSKKSSLVNISLFILLWSCTTAKASYYEECVNSINLEGYTRPKGDIYVEYGKPLVITCTVNYVENYTDYTPSDYLYFEVGNTQVPAEKIRKINDSTIELNDPNPEIQDNMYQCRLSKPSPRQQWVVCINKVIVSVRPSQVEDFKCISQNWDNLTCTWKMDPNPAKVSYKLSTKFRPYRGSMVFPCPLIEYDTDTVKCVWTPSTSPIYRPAQEIYYFTINATNMFGWNITKFTFNHWLNIVPDRAPHFNYTSIGTHSVDLLWTIPHTMVTFPRKLQYKVMHICLLDGKKADWKTDYVEPTNSDNFVNYTLPLENANDDCDIRVAMRVNNSLLWSPNASLIVRTVGTIPKMAPKTTLGTFQLIDRGPGISYRDAIIYWQKMPNKYQNGKEFRYNVKIINEPELANKSYVTINEAYAKFTELDKTKHYKFAIWSENINGTSKDISFVDIVEDGLRPKVPRVDPKIDYGNGTYELTWKPADLIIPIDNYTIFWCNHDKDRPFQCAGTLNWTIVPSNVTSYNVTVKEHQVTQFAIAANGYHGSSGMAWVQCIVIHNETQGKIHSVYVNQIGSRFIELHWNIDCKDGIGTVKGYIIYYCKTKGTLNKCYGPEHNMTIEGDGKTDSAVINNLDPYTTYRMTIAVISKRGRFSEQSEALYNTTYEDAPNKVEIIEELENVTINSIHVAWRSPSATNGIIKKYELKISHNNFTKKIPIEPASNNGTTFQHTITNLEGNTKYQVDIQACTISCSKPASKNITTLVGAPSQMEKPIIKYDDTTEDNILQWKPPRWQNGPLKDYEIQIIQLHKDQNFTLDLISAQPDDSIYIKKYCSFEQNGMHDKLFITMRAVNEYEEKPYVGAWSEVLPYSCQPSSKFLIWIWIAGSLVLVVIVCFGVRKCYLHCVEMRDVQVKLPPGLQLPPVIDGFPSWNGSNDPEDPPRKPPPADEEHLLEKLSEGRSGNSSGCSSGHDSVTSLESGNVVSSSSSDSGTEQPPSPDETFLRRRKAEASKPYVSADAVGNWKVNQIPAATGNYCVLGVNPTTTQREPESPYVPIAQPVVPAPSKGYVTMPINGIPPQTWGGKTPPPAGNYCVLGLNPEASTKTYISLPQNMYGNK